MADSEPKPRDYPNLHAWGQAIRAWNEAHNITSDDIVKQWNEERKQA